MGRTYWCSESKGRARWIIVAATAIATFAVSMALAVTALASGDVNVAGCANEALSGFTPALPDCRAYELVSPPYKAGFLSEAVALSGDGIRAIVDSGGAFSGTANDSLFGLGYYELERGPSGWTVAAALNPPAEAFPFSSQIGAGADLLRTLWVAMPRAQYVGPKESLYANELLVREANAGGEVTTTDVGPLAAAVENAVDEGSVPFSQRPYVSGEVGASNDLSHVVFAIDVAASRKRLTWPNDATVDGNSLYEYVVGAGGPEPALVGLNETGQLISQCGVVLGGYAGSDEVEHYNAISASGETVFFTAEKGGCNSGPPWTKGAVGTGPPARELFARVSGSRTVSISEPSAKDCEACNTSTPADAVFQGASQDGSKAFFITQQELVPGQTGMNLYEYDFDGPEASPSYPDGKVRLVSAGSVNPEVLGVARVSRDGSHAYFVAKGALTGADKVIGREPEQEAPTAGEDNLYVYDTNTGTLAFVATLSPADAVDWRVNDARPVQANGCLPAEAGCEAGRFLVFQSAAKLTPDDTSTVAQIFKYDAQVQGLERVSIGQGGYNKDGNATVPALAPSLSAPKYDRVSGDANTAAVTEGSLAVSDDGAYVFFQSASGLTPQAANAVVLGEVGGRPVYEQNVYEYHTGEVYLLSDGRDLSAEWGGQSNVSLLGTDTSGADALFSTADSLVPQDGDTQVDLYDARIGGGLAAPGSASCLDETCRGPLSEAPSALLPGGSAAAVAGENLTPSSTKPRSLTRAQKLSQAFGSCRKRYKKSKHKRIACEKQARSKYGTKPKAKTSYTARGQNPHRD